MSQTTQEKNPTGAEIQLVAMRVDDEMFGIDIANINTVITPQPITPVPQTPNFVKGVMNLRGRILPVLDLRTRFSLPDAKEDMEAGRIVIVEVDNFSAGLIVDEVSEVLRIPESSIEPPSTLLRSIEKEMITGIGRVQLNRRGKEPSDGFILLLDVRRVLTDGLMESQLGQEAA
jgi:purine-binding chemotaxis protein CheW